MTEKPTIVSHLTNATFGLWFPFFRWMARALPTIWVARLAEATAERAIWEREHVHDAICENLAHVLGLVPTHRRVEMAAREMISRHSRLWIDFLRYAGRVDVDPATLISARLGDERLVVAREQGTGAILLTAHVGNFELGGLFLKQLGLKTFAVYAPDPSPVIEAHRESARRSLGVTGIPVTSSVFAFVPILKALHENGFVAMQGDRDVSGTGRRLPFLGRTASFPVGPFRIAQASGAPLFPVFVLQEDDGRYRTVVEPPLRIAHVRGDHAADEAALHRAMESFVSTLERTIRENPTQWYLFTPFWDNGG